MFKVMIGAAVLGLCSGMAFALEAGDPERGAKLFKKCVSCHQVGPKAKSRTGPVLNEIVGRAAASVEDFRRYSKPMKALGDTGHVWTPEELDAFLEEPRKYLPKTRMTFRGMSKPQDRVDVIAYLVSLSPEDATVEGFTVAPEILAIEGDPEYGEYLSSECVTCHKADGADDGIPSITGWETELFATAMHAYREKNREHPVMNMISARLSDEEIAGLAAYFNGLGN